mmetsp:Transcript_13514/g.25413  ORF Transcript_13514/g.25413 Transcript_13514/m.25413 type:complete len:395 (+) Transcript_13514:34-1218(+)
MVMKALYIGSTWPQPSVSAAGVRTLGLAGSLLRLGYSLKFLSIKKPNPSQMKEIGSLDVSYCPLNDRQAFRAHLDGVSVVVMEKFTTEEAFSHFGVTRVLDTQDLHCLRLMRQELVASGVHWKDAMKRPIDFRDSVACREFASILRSHLTVFCSSYEASLASHLFPSLNSAVLPFFYDDTLISELKDQHSGVKGRKHFVWLGHFLHAPNTDAIDYLVKDIWPRIHLRLPDAQLHIYGSHPPKEVTWVSPGVVFKGFMKDLKKLSTYRAMLAPLRFGAGIKGKLADSWLYGLPTLTTSIGAEGYDSFPGLTEDDPNTFAETAINLYSSPELQLAQQAAGFAYLSSHLSMSLNTPKLKTALERVSTNPLQQLLTSETVRATHYQSLLVQSRGTAKH